MLCRPWNCSISIISMFLAISFCFLHNDSSAVGNSIGSYIDWHELRLVRDRLNVRSQFLAVHSACWITVPYRDLRSICFHRTVYIYFLENADIFSHENRVDVARSVQKGDSIARSFFFVKVANKKQAFISRNMREHTWYIQGQWFKEFW